MIAYPPNNGLCKCEYCGASNYVKELKCRSCAAPLPIDKFSLPVSAINACDVTTAGCVSIPIAPKPDRRLWVSFTK